MPGMQVLFYNLGPIKVEVRDELWRRALLMLDGLIQRAAVCMDDVFAEMERVSDERMEALQPELWKKFPGTWFFASLTTSEVDFYPVYFVVMRDAQTEDGDAQPRIGSLNEHLGIITSC